MTVSSGVRVLVVAKAPVPGRAKTRLGAVVGMEAAAELASAALLDTLEATTRFSEEYAASRHLALAGDLLKASGADELIAAVDGWDVFDQEGVGFGERLVHAHAIAAGGGDLVVQVGMDTPQVDPRLLGEVVEAATDGAAVVGPADDGGWWVLALRDPAAARCLAGVAMSTEHTGTDTVTALREAGLEVRATTSLRDVDTVQDADHVSRLAPHTRFARAWSTLRLTHPEAVRLRTTP